MAEQQYDWFFVNAKGEQDGPHTRDELLARWRAGEVRASTLVWAPGMGAWARFDEAFQDLLPPAPPLVASPPPTPQGQRPVDRPSVSVAQPASVAIPAAWQQPEASSPPAALVTPAGTVMSTGLHPWRRYFAKQVDVFIFSFGSVFLLMVLLEITSPEAAQRLNEGLENAVLASVIGVFFWAVCEWLCLWLFGGTPGRALYGIQIRCLDGTALGSEKALNRALLVGLKGIGLGIPIVALITAIVGYSTLEKEGRSSWDADLGTRVTHIVWSPMRVFGVVSTTVLVMFFAAIMIAVSANAG